MPDFVNIFKTQPVWEPEQASDLIEFFFGIEAKTWVEENHSEIVKEYTAIWWKKV